MPGPSIQYLNPGEVPSLNFVPEQRPGCWKIAAILLLLVGFPCGFISAAGMMSAQAAKPPALPSATITLTASATPTGTLRATVPPTYTPTRNLAPMENRPNAPTYTPTPTETPITPTPTACLGYHRVRAGQSVGSIATAWRVSSASVIKANNLRNPNLLYVGQILKIPGRCSTPTATATGGAP